MEHRPEKAISRYNYLYGEIDGAYHELSLGLGLSDSAMKILYVLCDNGGGCLLRTVCRSSGLSKQTVNSALRKLEQEGTVELERAGGKEKKVLLTAVGRELADRTAMQILRIEDELFASWPPEEVETYLTLTERYLNDFRKRADAFLKTKRSNGG